MIDNEHLLQLLLTQNQEYALLTISPEGTIAGWFAGAERIFGYRPDEIIGRSASVLFTADELERGFDEHELKIARELGKSEDDRWHVRKDGSRFWALGAVTALRDEQGELIGYAKLLRDRTDLRFKLDFLENRVQALEKLDIRKDLFISTLAHELRNPLTPLVNALHLIRSIVPNNSDLAYPVTLIERQVDFIRRLVEDLLDVTRMETGKVQLNVERVNLNELLTSVGAAMQSRWEERGQKFALLVPPKPIMLDADPTRLRQVFMNLLTNAIKYTPERGRISIRATIEDDEAVVHVEDTGEGIPPDLLPRIFDLFTQEAPAGGGLGIGLTVVRDLVRLHGGTAQVRSEGKGKGCDFVVRLPLEQRNAARGSPILKAI